MNTEEFQRKLTAILSADVVGYSRLMQDNEEATVHTLNKYKQIIFGLIERHNGRLVDSPGDNLLAEFTSVVDAVRCAVQIQEDLKVYNEELPPNRKMEFRIGINIGDVIQDGDRIYGDGVNVAARIESLADQGGICISRTAYDQVKKKINIDYEYLGEYVVKNINEPVRIYRIIIETEAMTPKAPAVNDVKEGPKTIAVLPFLNLSSDPEQEYFVDGLSEEILNRLSQIPDLTVIARTSSFSFRGKDKTIQEIASILGVDNILEGSVRKAGNALRITAQLVKAVDGSHLWSKTYDRELKEIFAVQEDIAKAVANELKITLGIGKSLKQLGGTDNVQAYELYMIAKGLYISAESFSDYKRALKSIDTAITLDPGFAIAWALKTEIHIYLSIFGPVKSAVGERNAALSSAMKAIELEPDLEAGYYSLGSIKMGMGEWNGAELAFQKALELTARPLSGNEVFIGIYYLQIGYIKKALKIFEQMRQNNPLDMDFLDWYITIFALLGDIKRTEKEYEHCKALFGNSWHPGTISNCRIGSGKPVSSNEIVFSNPIHVAAKKYLNSPKDGITKLRQLYSNDDNLSSADLDFISIYAAYFGDPEFAMEVIKRRSGMDATGVFWVWMPVMKEVRQTPQFKELMKEINLVDFWNKFGWPDICHQLDNGDFECD